MLIFEEKCTLKSFKIYLKKIYLNNRSVTTTPDQCSPGSNSNKVALHTQQISQTWASLSEAVFHSLLAVEKSYKWSKFLFKMIQVWHKARSMEYQIYQPLRSGRMWHKVKFFKRSLTGLNSEFSFS